MKRKEIIVISMIMLLIVVIACILITKNNQKYIMRDGMVLALTLDGKNISSFPEQGPYEIDVDCGTTAYGRWLAAEWKLAVENITGNVKCNVNFTSNPSLLKNEVESINTIDNNGYRYSGKTPDNWIWFNGEKWRIIGSVPTTLNDGTETKLVKIIRSESIGGLAFHSSTTDTPWGSNTLYTLLNTKYYGKLDATGASPCLVSGTSGYPLCNYTNIGISEKSTDYYGRMIKDVYWNVGKVAPNTDSIVSVYTNEAKTKSTVTGRIGLMNASDYGYATSEITYSDITLGSLSAYTQNNWLYGQGEEWTLTPFASGYMVYVQMSGNATNTYYGHSATIGTVVRPVVYLDSSVYIISGDGTEGNPYQIGLPKITPIFNGSNMSIYVDDGSTSFTYNAGGTLSCTSSNTSVATCSNDSITKTITITPVSSGTTTITITSTEDPIYEAGSVTYTIEVFGLPDGGEIPGEGEIPDIGGIPGEEEIPEI